MPLLNRLSTLWKEENINSSEEKKSQLCASLGYLGCFIFAAPSKSLQAIQQQHEITQEEEQFLTEFAASTEAAKVLGTSSPSSSLDVLLPPFTKVIFEQTGAFSPSQQQQLQSIFSILFSSSSCCSSSSSSSSSPSLSFFGSSSSPENLLEIFVYLLAVFNYSENNNNKNNKSSSPPITLDVLLAALCTTFPPTTNTSMMTMMTTKTTIPCPLIVALIRTAANLDQSQQNPVLNSSAASLEDVLQRAVKLFVSVLSWKPHQQQQQQQQQEKRSSSSSSSSSDVSASMLMLLKDDFLRQVCAPVLSQFGFEFLWKYFGSGQNSSISNDADDGDSDDDLTPASAIIDLLHYCQSLTYSERLQLVLPRALTHQLLPSDNIVTSTSFFGGFGENDSSGGGNGDDVQNTLIPSFWENAFKMLQHNCFYPPPLSSSRQKQTHNFQQQRNTQNGDDDNADELLLLTTKSVDDNGTTSGDGGKNDVIVALSVLRRNRFAAKVETSLNNNTKKRNDNNNNSKKDANQYWIELYRSFLSSSPSSRNNNNETSTVEISNDIKNQMQKVLAVSSSATTIAGGIASSLPFDPIMLATYYFTCSSSVTESGRCWTLEKIFSPAHEILQAMFSSGTNSVSSSSPSSSSSSFAWLLSALVLIDTAVSKYTEEEDNPTKQKLFEAAFVRTMLHKIQTLMTVSTRPVLQTTAAMMSGAQKKNRRQPLPLLNIMKFDSFICGFAPATTTTTLSSSSKSTNDENDQNNNNNNNSSEIINNHTVNRGAASFRNAFCRYSIVKNEFRKIIRSSWEVVFEEERNTLSSSSSSFSSSSIERMHYTISELFTLLTVVLSRAHRVLLLVMSNIENNNNNNEDQSSSFGFFDFQYNESHQFILTTLQVCLFLASEWRFAVESALSAMMMPNYQKNNEDCGDQLVISRKKKLAGDVSSVVELCDSILVKFDCGKDNKNNHDGDQSVKRLRVIVEEMKNQVYVY